MTEEPRRARRAVGPDRLDRPDHDPFLYELFPALATDVGWTLERTRRALGSIGDPHQRFTSLHIGGTNGKGSVTTTLASVMTATGHRAGCYTSPHLVSFGERVRVDGAPLSEDTLKGYAAEIRDAVSACGLTFFEAVTVLALHAFAREGVDVAAVEVGLGGRLDATNVLEPEVAAVTNVALDHTDYLGATLLEIAREKAGIMKPGVPFVTTENDPEVLGLFGRLASQVGAPMEVVPPNVLRRLKLRPEKTTFRMETGAWGILDVTTPLAGRHQAMNAALTVAVSQHLPEGLRPSARELLAGIADVRYAGRDEVVERDGRAWLLDVAHNAAGMSSLVDTLDSLDLPTPRVAVVGIAADKDWRSMLPLLLERCGHVILSQPPTVPPERRWSLAEVEEAMAEHRGRMDGSGGITLAVEDFSAALEKAAALTPRGTIVVTGSVHTVGGAMRLLGLPGEG